MLATYLRSFARALRVLNYRAICPASAYIIFNITTLVENYKNLVFIKKKSITKNKCIYASLTMPVLGHDCICIAKKKKKIAKLKALFYHVP